MNSDISTIMNAIYLCSAMVLFLCVSGSLILFKRWNGRRARLYLGVILLVIAVPFFCVVFESFLTPPYGYKDCIIQPISLTAFIVFDLILLPYGLELVNPKWYIERSVLKRILPALLLLALMWFAWFVEPLRLAGLHDYFRNFFRLSVLTRTVMLIVPYVYLVRCAKEVLAFDMRWKEWSAERGVVTSRATAWIRTYFIGMLAVSIALTLVMFTTSPVFLLVLDIIFVLFLSYIIYKAVFTDAVYPDSFYCRSENGDFRPDEYDAAFINRIPEYVELIRKWFDEKKPYLDSHFKLENVKEVVPMNRTYLSRIFNEGFGVGFSDYVRNLRMQEARRLLGDEPEMGIGEVAERCGFSTHSSFHRSFMQNNEGMTPGEYRQLIITRKKKD